SASLASLASLASSTSLAVCCLQMTTTMASRTTDVLGTVDYVTPDGRTVLFRTADVEKGRLVFQLGTANATTALQAAQKVLQYVVFAFCHCRCSCCCCIHC